MAAPRLLAWTVRLLLVSIAVACRTPTSEEVSPPSEEPAPTSAHNPPAHDSESEADEKVAGLLASLGIRLFSAERALEVDGWINMQRGLIEVFACAPEGKTHESVLVLDCVPSGLHAGLLALGLEPGTPAEAGTQSEYMKPEGPGVRVDVRWSDEAGEHVARAEDWIWSEKDGAPMVPCAWVFAGSFLQPVPGADEAAYAADSVKSLITTYHDATSILENPYLDGIDDTVYFANERAVPAVGTPVTVVLSPAQDG
jgi:hypothetical protein